MKKTTMAFAVSTANAALEVYSKFEKAITKTFPIAAMVLIFAIFALTANAAVFTVTSAADNGNGSLRNAIDDANNLAGADTIVFSPGVFGSVQRIISISQEYSITSDMTIDATNTKSILINGGTLSRIFNISNATVEISNLTILGGRVTTPEAGGGFKVNGGTTTLKSMSIWSCSSTGNGGGIYVASGNLILQNSTVYGNGATLNGGGLFIDSANASAAITSSTFSVNSSSQSGGAISVVNGSVTGRNSIFGNNFATTAPDISGTLNSQGYNLIKNTSGATINGTTTGNVVGSDPALTGFNDNGGGSFTLLLQNTSPAIDAGDPALANTTDQRRARRNTDGNNNGIAGVDIGAVEKQRNLYDTDGEDSADFSITRIVSGTNLLWYSGIRVVSSFQNNFTQDNIGPSPNGLSIKLFGLTTDITTPGDYDGDGKMDVAVYRPSEGIWYISGSAAGFRAFRWGLADDIPVPADYDGDGKTDVAVYRNGTWYIFNSLLGYTGEINLGGANDKPVPADYDGDLKADPAIFNAGVWTINRSTAGQTTLQFGISADVPVPADYNGDGSDELAVFRPAEGTWYILRSDNGYDAVPFGLSNDKLVPADYDGDGKTDIAVWRSNTISGRGDWYLLQSRDGYIQTNFGFSTDYPVVNSNIRQ